MKKPKRKRRQIAAATGTHGWKSPDKFDPMRTQGSCRFAPYYKAQWFDEKQLAWRDVQKQFATPDEARSAFGKGKWRVMEITEKGRNPL